MKTANIPETRGRKKTKDTLDFLDNLTNLQVGHSFQWVGSDTSIINKIKYHNTTMSEYAIRTLNGIKHIFRTK